MGRILSMKQKIVLSLTVALLSVVATLIGAEVLVRIVNPVMSYSYLPQQIYISHFRPSSLIPWELRPNNHSRFKMLEFDTTVVTNSHGLRDNEVDFSKPRILCMGDSFTFGFGVENEETFCAILERLFQGKYDFVNTGFADGYSPDTYALWLSKHRETLAPHSIIVCLFSNDLWDVNANTWLRNGKVMTPEERGLPDRIVKTGYTITEDGASIREGFLARIPPSLRRLIKRSYLIAFLRDRLLHDVDWSIRGAMTNGEERAMDQKFTRSLELLREVAGDRLLALYLIEGPSEIGRSALSHMDELVFQFAAMHGIPVLSNNNEFSKEDFFSLDSHFSRQGHAKSARYLYKALLQLGL